MFGEIAAQYDEARPSYPDDLFDAVMAFGDLRAGDRARDRRRNRQGDDGLRRAGLDVHALEPSAEMAAVLRAKGIDAEEITFEDWALRPGAFPLVYAAQAWHWVHGDDRYETRAAALRPGGTVAFFWNKGRSWKGRWARQRRRCTPTRARDDELDRRLARLGRRRAGGVSHSSRRSSAPFTWSRSYTREEWTRLLGTALRSSDAARKQRSSSTARPSAT